MSTTNSRNAYRRRRMRRKRAKEPRFLRRMRVNLFGFFVLFMIVFLALMVKIYYIDYYKGTSYRKNAMKQQTYTNTTLNYQRGSIKDRNSTTLATSVRKFNLVLEPRTLITKPELELITLDAIAEHFQVDINVLKEVVKEKPNSMYEHIDALKELDSKTVDSFKKKMKENEDIIGVWFEETYKRNYPLKSVACNVIGFMSSENNGTYGIEEMYNDILNGTTGREFGYFDSNMNLQRTVKEAKNGNNVILTIDANVQQIVEEEIAWFQKEGTGAETVSVMMMNPKNGEVLAMASNSTFDLNNPRDMTTMYTQQQIDAMSEEDKKTNLMKMWSNFCIGSAYEPGSTYKPFTIAAALDENLINDNSTFNCHGVVNVADRNIHCSNRNGHGTLDLRHALMESCNAALMDIGLKLKRDKFIEYNKLFGFGQRTGIDLPGETSGLLHSENTLNEVELATSSFGQTQTMTMVQMLSGFCSLVNGGNYYQPHVVKEIQNLDGKVVESVSPKIVKKTVTEDTSKKLRSYLKSTVEEGTAAPAQVKGYSIGGKTGTAEKRPVSAKKYLVSFIGCVPVEDPEVAIYVIVDEPKVQDQAHSTYATEFASRIMKKVLPFLGQYATN